MDIEAALIAWLNENVCVPAYADVPEDKPPEFITVERTGGAKDSLVVDRPTIAVQCWALRRAKAASIAYDIDAIMPRLTELPIVSRVKRNSLYNFPSSKGEPRYQIVYDITTVS